MGGKSTESHQSSIKTLEDTTELMRLIADNQPEEFLWDYGNALSNLSWSLFMTGEGLRGSDRIQQAMDFLKNFYFNVSKDDRRNIRANYGHAALLRGDIDEARRRYKYIASGNEYYSIWRQQLVADLRELQTVPTYSQYREDMNRIINDLLANRL